MKSICSATGRLCASALLALMNLGLGATAQTTSILSKSADAEPYRTFYLANLADEHEPDEVVSDLRIMLPHARLFYVPSEGAISMRGTADDMELAAKILSEIDRPRKVYRVTYSITEIEGDKPAGTQHMAFLVVAGGNAFLKRGNRVPLVIGSPEETGSTPSPKVQYLDVGLNIEASIEGNADGLRLHSKVEQTRMGDEKSGLSVREHMIYQTSLNEVSMLTPGKPTLLGSLDIPGTTRHEEITVVSEPVK